MTDQELEEYLRSIAASPDEWKAAVAERQVELQQAVINDMSNRLAEATMFYNNQLEVNARMVLQNGELLNKKFEVISDAVDLARLLKIVREDLGCIDYKAGISTPLYTMRVCIENGKELIDKYTRGR